MFLSELDKALIRAQKDPEENESAYYELFLNTEILIPTHSVPEEVETRISESDETIDPIILPDNGKNYVPIFDSKERLEEWADGNEMGIVGVSGFTILKMFVGSGLYLILNANSDQLKEFCPEELEWLISNIEDVNPE